MERRPGNVAFQAETERKGSALKLSRVLMLCKVWEKGLGGLGLCWGSGSASWTLPVQKANGNTKPATVSRKGQL